jgi:hypothetical protein
MALALMIHMEETTLISKELLHCRFQLWNFSLVEDFAPMEFSYGLASLTFFYL